MKLTELPPSGFRRTPWKNGGGINTDIADDGVADGWTSFNWRLGRTAIVEPGPFSDFTGYERLQMVITGEGLVLVTPDGEIDLRKRFVPVRYDGAVPIVTRLEAGAVEVINLVAAQGRYVLDLATLQPGMTLSLKAGLHIAYAPIGAAGLSLADKSVTLAAGHALRIEPDARVTLTATAGLIVLASIMLASEMLEARG